MVKAMAAAMAAAEAGAVGNDEPAEGDELIENNDSPQVGIFDENAEQSSLPPDGEFFNEPPVIDEAADDPADEDATDIHDELVDDELLLAAGALYKSLHDYELQLMSGVLSGAIYPGHPIHDAVCRLEVFLHGNKLPPGMLKHWRHLLQNSRSQHDVESKNDAATLRLELVKRYPAAAAIGESAADNSTSSNNGEIDVSAIPDTPEARYEAELRAKRDEYAESGMRIYHAKEELKGLKEIHKEIEEQLDELERRGPRYDYSGDAEHIKGRSGYGEENGDPAAGGSVAASTAAGSDVLQSAPADRDQNAWRFVAVEDLGLPGAMSKILREDNGITTLGELADFGDKNGGDFSKLKKFGPAKAEKLRDELLPKFWRERPELVGGGDSTDSRTAEWFAAEDGGQNPAAEVIEGNSPAAESGVLQSAPANETPDDETAPDGFTPEALQARADELLADKSHVISGPHLTSDRYWESGREAFGRGVELIECPYATAAERDDWLRGWLWAQGLEGKEGGEGL